MRQIVLQLMLALLTFGTVHAADIPVDDPLQVPEASSFEKRWQVTAALYGWGAGMGGKAGFGGRPAVDFDISLNEILNDLDATFMGLAEARYGRFGIFGDLIYTKLSSGSTATGPIGGDWKVDLDTQLFIGTAGAEYRLAQRGKSSLDAMVAARFYSLTLDTDVEYCGPLCQGAGLPARNFRSSDSEQWVDPMIGLKGRLQGSSPWYLTGWGMIGGFGVSSDFAWDAFGGVGYDFNNGFSLIAGYRGLGVDYESSNLLFDVVMDGPVIGGSFRF
ncbi:hypothetical protein [Roseibium aggregatum]|uniref:hypothetical protein n=1 Tax=Roseibium aggregatum TaxID=187304 RepID=UPI003A973B80